MSVKEEVIEYIDNNSSLFTGLSDQIWDLAETKFEEFKSSDLYCRILEEEGFSVERGIGGLQTAFKGTYGTDEGPSIGFLGEFDALPGLSQQAGVHAGPARFRRKGRGRLRRLRRGLLRDAVFPGRGPSAVFCGPDRKGRGGVPLQDSL